ncbi:MAG: transcriptional activator domain-containing protein [Chloroflexi bacterium]|nr:transcriptional activator domain-containing protein [Chloroflexota bacterium]
MSARLAIRLLGDFRLEIDGRAVPRDAWRQGRAAALIKLLALAPRHRLTRDELIEALWPGVSPEAGGVSTRKAVHFARRAVGGEEAIAVKAGAIELWPGGVVTTDVERFEAAMASAGSTGDVERFREAAELYAGDLLPDDRDEAWCEDRRRVLREGYLRVLRGARLWSRILDVDPTDEEAHRELIRSHLEAGNRQAAIRQFERLREVLRDELGVGPDPLSVALYERVLEREGQDAPTAAERARALLAWGMIHWKRNDLEEAERTALEARALAIDAGLGAQVGEASSLLASIGVARGHWREFLRNELLETVRRTPDVAPFVFDSNLCFTEFCLYLPEGRTEMSGFAAELQDAAATAGSARAAAHAELVRGETELLGGQVEQADATLRRAAGLHRDAKTNSGESLSLERLAEVATALGQRWKARRLLQRALRLAEGDPLGSHLLVKIHGAMVEAAADPAEAAAVAANGERALADSDVCQQCSMSFRMAAARAFADVGDLPSARRHLDEAARISDMWQGGPWPAAVREVRAHLEAASGHRAEDQPPP